MKVNSFNQTLITTHSQNCRKKTCSSNFNSSHACFYNNSDKTSFAGLFSTDAVRQSFYKMIINPKEELYSINLLDKKANKLFKARLKYISGDNKDSCNLEILSEANKRLGSVNLDSNDWAIQNFPKNYLRLHTLLNESRATYGKVGSTLIQAAVEKSLETNANGRLFVNAYNMFDTLNDPFVFYNKMGLSVINPFSKSIDINKYKQLLKKDDLKLLDEKFGQSQENIDEYLLEIYKAKAKEYKCNPDGVFLCFGESMYLHDNNVEKLWIPIIKTSPIFSYKNRIK